MKRRTLIGAALAGASSGALCAAARPLSSESHAAASPELPPAPERATLRGMRRIATEEAFIIPEMAERYGVIAARGGTLPDLFLISEISKASTPFGRGLLDLDHERLRLMDESGLTMQLLSLTSPGVQILEPADGTAMAALANERLAAFIAKHPQRYAGLAAVAVQDPKSAAREVERAISKLGLNGVLINSSTNEEYLDQEKFWPVLEAIEALDRPLYIHPRSPSRLLAEPFRDYGLLTALLGYHVETSLTAMRLIMSGVLERFPRLKIVLGHMGETIPYNLWRSDYWAAFRMRNGAPKQMLPGEIFRRNFYVTTSGMEDDAVLRFCIEQLGAERIMFAVDYPYQQIDSAVGFMDRARIQPEHRELIYSKNAERHFHIKA